MGSRPCYNCAKLGHKAKECPKPRKHREELKRKTDDEGAPVLKKKKERTEYVEKGKCFRCLEVGHSIMECMNEAVCHNCSQVGHKKTECSQPLKKVDIKFTKKNIRQKNPPRQKNSGGCFKCGQEGHKAYECKEAKKEVLSSA